MTSELIVHKAETFAIQFLIPEISQIAFRTVIKLYYSTKMLTTFIHV